MSYLKVCRNCNQPTFTKNKPEAETYCRKCGAARANRTKALALARLIAEQPGITRARLAEIFDVSERTIQQRLTELSAEPPYIRARYAGRPTLKRGKGYRWIDLPYIWIEISP